MTTTTARDRARTAVQAAAHERRAAQLRDRARAMVAARTDAQLINDYRTAAQIFAANPQAEDSGALILTMGWMDAELSNRNIPCCETCSVPTAADWHDPVLHTPDADADTVADVLTDAAMSVLTSFATDALTTDTDGATS